MDRDPCAGFSLIELLVTFVILGQPDGGEAQP
jgi:prepilin-type N-terminal cleavage/methylation domain-containing protein